MKLSELVSSNRYYLSEWLIPVFVFAWSGMFVFAAIDFSMSVVTLCTEHPDHLSRVDLPSAMAAWDGRWQVDIIRHGYHRKINWQDLNPAAFPPLYPLISSMLCKIGLREEIALLLVSSTSFLGFLIVFYCYCRERGMTKRWATICIAFVALSPFSYFFRMAYTESLFCFLAACLLLGIQQNWNPWVLAAIVACAGATRVVGVTLIPVLGIAAFLYYAGQRFRYFRTGVVSLMGGVGFFAFMVHLHLMQGNALAMFEAQKGWTIRPEGSFLEQILHAVSGQPLWDAYQSDCRCYWGNSPPRDLPLFNMQFWNPIVLVLCGSLMVIGWRFSVLRWFELLYCFVVIGVPYFTQGYRICLHSQSRYALAAFPLALVLIWSLRRFDQSAIWILLTLNAILLFGNTAMFIGWYFNY